MNNSTKIVHDLHVLIREHSILGANKLVLGEPTDKAVLDLVIRGKRRITRRYAAKLSTWIFLRLRELDVLDAKQNSKERPRMEGDCVRVLRKTDPDHTQTFKSRVDFTIYLSNVVLAEESGLTSGNSTESKIKGVRVDETAETKGDLENWGVELSCLIRDHVSDIRKASTKYGGDGRVIQSTIIHAFVSQFLHGISEDLDRCCFCASGNQRRDLVNACTPNAQSSVYTLSYWERENWTDDIYANMYLRLVRDCRDVEVNRIFVCDKVSTILQKLCDKLNNNGDGGIRLGKMNAIMIRRSQVPRHHWENLKSLWVIDGQYGTRSLPFFNRDGKPAAASDTGHVIWGREAGNEFAFVKNLWGDVTRIAKAGV